MLIIPYSAGRGFKMREMVDRFVSLRSVDTQCHLTHRIAVTRPATASTGGNAPAASTGHQKASQPLSDPAGGSLSFAAVRWVRKLNGGMVKNVVRPPPKCECPLGQAIS